MKTFFTTDELTKVKNLLKIEDNNQSGIYLQCLNYGLAIFNVPVITHALAGLMNYTRDKNRFNLLRLLVEFNKAKDGLIPATSLKDKFFTILTNSANQCTINDISMMNKKIDTLISNLKAKGEQIVNQSKLANLYTLIYMKVYELNEGQELSAALDIVSLLETNRTLEDCYKALIGQDHSNTNFHNVIAIIKELTDRGLDFEQFIYIEQSKS